MNNIKKRITSVGSSFVIIATLIASRAALDNSTLIGRYNLVNTNIERNYDFDETYETSYEDSNLLNVIFDENNDIIYDDMVPQGITLIDDYVVISAYDTNYLNNSMLYLFDRDFNYIKSITLDNHAHVGSVSCDKKRGLLWVAGSYGCVNAYALSSIIYGHDEIKPIYKNVYVGKHLPSYLNPFVPAVSYLTIDGDYLYVGNYSLIDNANLKRYRISIDDKKTLHLDHDKSYRMPTKVQGVSIYHDGEDDYILFSRSCGKKYSSIVQVCEFSDEIIDFRGVPSHVFEAPKMLEQVSIDGNDLYVLNESQAKKYFNGFREDTVLKTDVKKLVKK